jgi:integrase
MPKNPKKTASAGGPLTTTAITLHDVLNAVERIEALSVTRRRDLRSAVSRVASLLGDDPGRIPLDLPALSVKLAAVNPVAVGLTSKTFSNIKSDFVAGVKASGLAPIRRSARAPLNADWTRVMARLSGQRARIGLSKLARHASALCIAPEQVNDAVIENFIAAVRDGSLHRKPNVLHRTVSTIWNEVAARQPGGLNLQQVIVPSFRRPPHRIEWTLLTNEFHKDVDEHHTWCAGSDSFAADARSRPLAPRTLKLRRDQIHAAVTALIESGVEPTAITSIGDLVSPENFKRILRRRHEIVGGRENMFNHDLAQALVQIGRESVRVDADVLVELRRLAGKVPTPMSGLTDKNKRFLRQFDDPEVFKRLYNFPGRLWDEVKRDRKPNRYTLAKAQAALAVAILCYMPVRLQNLSALAFDVHLFMREGARATSSLELAAGEVKNRREVAFDIPSHVAKMIIEYRNRIAPKIIGHKPERLFVNVDGAPKNQWAVAWLIRTYLRKRAGITISAHQFRHLSAKVVLDAEPGNFETPRQMLGHRSLNTTVERYAGIDSRRAARHHQRLVEEALADEKPIHRSKKKAS